MIARVFRYSFAQAKTKAMKARLLSSEDWSVLLRMKDLQDAVKYLRGTAYGAALSHLSGLSPDMRALSLALHDALFGDYAGLSKAVPTEGARLLKRLLLRFEAENLKTILRGIWKGGAPSEIRPLLFRLGRLSRLPVDELLAVRRIEPALALLKTSPFHAALLHAFPQYQAQGRLFPLEIAVDIAVPGQVAAGIEAMGRIERRGAQALIGRWIDGLALSWLARFRHVYNLSPEEAIHYTPSEGRSITLRDIGRLARAGNLAAFIAVLPPFYREVLSPAKDWMQLHILLEREFVEELFKAIGGDPFRITLPLSYLLLKESEVRSLESLLSALELKHPAKSFMQWISPPIRGGFHVQV